MLAVSQTLTGTFVPGGRLASTSNDHAAGALGALVIGFSRELYRGRLLPIDLDPILGTAGCLHFQHAAFEPRVPGGLSWSDGVTVNVGY